MSTLTCFRIWEKHIHILNHIREVHNIIGTHDTYDSMMLHFQQIYNSTKIKCILKLFKSLNDMMKLTDNEAKITLNLKNSRDFLSCFMIHHHSIEIGCDDSNVIDKAHDIMTHYEKMIVSKSVYSLNELVDFVLEINAFCQTYQEWETKQKNIEITEISQSFWMSVAELTQNIEVLRNNITELTDLKNKGETMYEGREINGLLTAMEQNYESWKNQFESGFVDLKQKVITQVKKLNGDSGVKYFESLVPLFIDSSFTDNIKQIVHNAFWDSLTTDLAEGKYDKLLTLLNELKYYMALCVPTRYDVHNEIDTAIDIDLWKQMLEHNAFNNDDIIGFITYVYNKIKEWCSAADKNIVENKMKETLANLEKVSTGEITLPEYISNFIKDSFQFLENIISMVNHYKITDEYKAIKGIIEDIHNKK
jgi:hypothetical protein